MKKPLPIIKEVKVELTKLYKRLKRRDKTTFVSVTTLNLSEDLVESIRADSRHSKALKKQAKESVNWPFPIGKPIL